MNAGVGYGQISTAMTSGQNADSESEHMTAFVTYSVGMVTAGAQMSWVEDASAGGDSEEATGWGLAVNLMDGLSVSYGEREIEHQKHNLTTEDQEGIAVAYTMGAAKITFQNNETSANGGTAGTNDEATEIALSLSF